MSITWDDIARDFDLAIKALEHATNTFKAVSYEELENTVDAAVYIETDFRKARAKFSRHR